MRDTRTVIVLSVVATVLVLGIGACIAINPLTAIGLSPILAAISLIISAIGDGPTEPEDPPKATKAPPTSDGVKAAAAGLRRRSAGGRRRRGWSDRVRRRRR
jgi:hypothetical protein